MKKIKIGVTDMISRLCAVGLTLLGFGCSHSDDPSEGIAELMYGCPYGTWKIDGFVTDKDGNPVENAEIRVTWPDMESGIRSLGTTETNENGNYNVESGGVLERLKVVCLPDDPELKADSTIVEMKYHKDKNDKDHWYRGEAQATVDFKLRSKDR